MPAREPRDSHTYALDVDDRAEMLVLLDQLSDLPPEHPAVRLVTDQGEFAVPPAIRAILLDTLESLTQGLAVDVTPRSMLLTTQQAADALGVSRPTMVRLLEDGQIPFERPGKQRKVKLTDLLEYRKRRRRVGEMFDRLAELDAQADDDDFSVQEASALIKEMRAERRAERDQKRGN